MNGIQTFRGSKLMVHKKGDWGARMPRGIGYAAALAAVAFILVAFGVIVTSDGSSAEMWPLNVTGTIKDSLGNPIQGANVTVELWEGGTLKKTEWWDHSEPNGFYTASFLPGDWTSGWTIKVTAVLGVDSGINTAVAGSSGLETIDVTIGIVIPEFGGLVQIVAVVAASCFCVIVIADRRKECRR